MSLIVFRNNLSIWTVKCERSRRVCRSNEWESTIVFTVKSYESCNESHLCRRRRQPYYRRNTRRLPRPRHRRSQARRLWSEFVAREEICKKGRNFSLVKKNVPEAKKNLVPVERLCTSTACNGSCWWFRMLKLCRTHRSVFAILDPPGSAWSRAVSPDSQPPGWD